jgi:fused signal recognition particle receptor
MLASSTPTLLIILGVLVAVGLPTAVVLARRNSSKSATPSQVSSETTSAPASVTETFTSGSNVSATEPSPVVSEEAADAGPASDELELATSDGVGAGIEAPNVDVRERTAKSRGVFASAFAKMRGRSGITQDTWDDLEETLLKADIGIGLTTRLLEPLRASVKSGDIRNADDLINALRDGMTAQLAITDRSLHLDAAELPNVWLFVGVNGVGKTTTIGKIATAEAAKGTSILMAAGDTFRAAAAEQLQVWSERSGAAFVRGAEGGDPASVIFDGIQSAASKNITLVLGDTAGRLQNKSNLMEELKKVRRVADKAPGTVNEVLLVIDATTGQNGLSQAREFAAATDVTGVVLTKLDGSAKGGIVFAIETDLGIPVKLVGLGEGAHDLVPFNPSDYVSALFE